MAKVRGHIWQIVATLVAVAAIVATYDVFFRSKPIKEVKVITNPPLSLVDINPEAAKDIEVLYKGKPVNNISLFQIQITNTGNQPILESEYSKPLSLSFSPNVEILDAAVIATNPPNIGMDITQQTQNQIELSKTLFNPQDTISIKFVLKGNTGDSVLNEFRADGRIAGIQQIAVISSLEQNKTYLPFIWGLISGGLSGVILLLATVFLYLKSKKHKTETES